MPSASPSSPAARRARAHPAARRGVVRARWAATLAFLTNGAMLGALIPHYPQAKAAFGLDADLDLTTSGTSTHPGYSGKPADAAKDLERRRADGWSVLATMAGPGGARHAAENLRGEGMAAVFAERLEGYADLVEIGRGGDSVVYRARDRALGRDVVVKVLRRDAAAGSGAACSGRCSATVPQL